MSDCKTAYDIMDVFKIEEDEMSMQSVLALERVWIFITERFRFERLSDLDRSGARLAPLVNEQAQVLVAHAKDLKRDCTTAELKAINDLYDIYLARQATKDKLNKLQLSALARYTPLIKEMYGAWTSAVNKKNEIYRSLSRAPGSGFSRQ